MRQSLAPLRGQGVSFAAPFSAGYITNMLALIYDRHNLHLQEIDEGDVEAGIGKR